MRRTHIKSKHGHHGFHKQCGGSVYVKQQKRIVKSKPGHPGFHKQCGGSVIIRRRKQTLKGGIVKYYAYSYCSACFARVPDTDISDTKEINPTYRCSSCCAQVPETDILNTQEINFVVQQKIGKRVKRQRYDIRSWRDVKLDKEQP